MKNYRQALRDLPAGKDTVEKCKMLHGQLNHNGSSKVLTF